jgi:hypothetical protein
MTRQRRVEGIMSPATPATPPWPATPATPPWTTTPATPPWPSTPATLPATSSTTCDPSGVGEGNLKNGPNNIGEVGCSLIYSLKLMHKSSFLIKYFS